MLSEYLTINSLTTKSSAHSETKLYTATFRLRDAVRSNCDFFRDWNSSEGVACSSDVGYVPHSFITLLRGIQELQVTHSSGIWDSWRWGDQPPPPQRHRISVPAAEGAVLYAAGYGDDTVVDHWVRFNALKSELSDLLRMPMAAASETLPFPLSAGSFIQTFPILKYSIGDHLPELTSHFRGKSKGELKALLVPQLFHSSAWSAVSLHVQVLAQCDGICPAAHEAATPRYEDEVEIELEISFILQDIHPHDALWNFTATAQDYQNKNGLKGAVDGIHSIAESDKTREAHEGMHHSVALPTMQVTRNVYDSRALDFKVVSKYHVSQRNESINMQLSREITHRMHVIEMIPDSYDIMWGSFHYEVYSNGDDRTAAIRLQSIFDLDDIRWTDAACGQHQITTTKQCLRTVQFTIPIDSSLSMIRISYRARKRFIIRDAQSIDTSRGLIAPSSGVYLSAGHQHHRSTIVFSEPSLLVSPIPDMSMPYNVITIVSTLTAFFVGSFINALIKREKRKKES